MKLDEILAGEPHMNDVNTFEQSFTESIRQASDDVIPKSTNSSRHCSWTNVDYVNLLEQRRKCKDPVHLRKLNLSITNMRTKLKNYYFSNLANNLNLANEAIKVEEEFRLCKTNTMSNHSNKQLISNDKLTTFCKTILKITRPNYNLR